MKKYLLSSTKHGGLDMTLTYGEDGFVTSMVVNKPCTTEVWRGLWGHPPFHTETLHELVQRSDGLYKYEEVPTDLSFPVFWDAYAHKVGNKGKVEKLWEALSEADRIAALAGIERYRSFLAARPHMEKAFAETWLRNRRWEV
jgi:hypothetical protein